MYESTHHATCTTHSIRVCEMIALQLLPQNRKQTLILVIISFLSFQTLLTVLQKLSTLATRHHGLDHRSPDRSRDTRTAVAWCQCHACTWFGGEGE